MQKCKRSAQKVIFGLSFSSILCNFILMFQRVSSETGLLKLPQYTETFKYCEGGKKCVQPNCSIPQGPPWIYLMTSIRDRTLTSETPKDNTVFRRVDKNSFTSHSCRGKMNSLIMLSLPRMTGFCLYFVVRTHLW